MRISNWADVSHCCSFLYVCVGSRAILRFESVSSLFPVVVHVTAHVEVQKSLVLLNSCLTMISNGDMRNLPVLQNIASWLNYV